MKNEQIYNDKKKFEGQYTTPVVAPLLSLEGGLEKTMGSVYESLMGYDEYGFRRLSDL
ncbi:MAG: hypothetical protein ABIH82_01200 [Candidatus Woesearchaeota archaeon]